MEQSDWSSAEQNFTAGLHGARSPGEAAEAASYLAAVKLVKAQV